MLVHLLRRRRLVIVDEWYREAARRYAHHGYMTISPNLYHRDGDGEPYEVGARVRAAGGIPDAQALGDLEGPRAQRLGDVGVYRVTMFGEFKFLQSGQR